MNRTLRLLSALTLSIVVTSCASKPVGMANGVINSAGNMVRAIGRTFGLVSQADPLLQPLESDSESVQARGKVVQHQGIYGDSSFEPRIDKVAGR